LAQAALGSERCRPWRLCAAVAAPAASGLCSPSEPPCADMDLSQAPAAPQRPQNFHTMSLGLPILLPSIVFLVVSCVIVFLFHTAQAVVWIMVVVCFLVSLLLMSVRKAPLRDGPNFWLNLGFLCVLATLSATLTSVYNWQNHMARYWAYEGQRMYTNVLPSEPALSHIDAGKIIFSSDAHLDLASYAEHKDGASFCVAPVVAAARQAVVEYWATGVDCCGGGNFTCGAIQGDAKGAGLVLLEAGRFSSDNLASFRSAALKAGASHGTAPSQDALFVRWVEDAEEAQLAFWSEGVRFLVGSIIVYSVLSVVAGTMLHCCRRAAAGKGKPEDRRFPV